MFLENQIPVKLDKINIVDSDPLGNLSIEIITCCLRMIDIRLSFVLNHPATRTDRAEGMGIVSPLFFVEERKHTLSNFSNAEN